MRWSFTAARETSICFFFSVASILLERRLIFLAPNVSRRRLIVLDMYVLFLTAAEKSYRVLQHYTLLVACYIAIFFSWTCHHHCLFLKHPLYFFFACNFYFLLWLSQHHFNLYLLLGIFTEEAAPWDSCEAPEAHITPWFCWEAEGLLCRDWCLRTARGRGLRRRTGVVVNRSGGGESFRCLLLV